MGFAIIYVIYRNIKQSFFLGPPSIIIIFRISVVCYNLFITFLLNNVEMLAQRYNFYCIFINFAPEKLFKDEKSSCDDGSAADVYRLLCPYKNKRIYGYLSQNPS